jgi:hypothetical protein
MAPAPKFSCSFSWAKPTLAGTKPLVPVDRFARAVADLAPLLDGSSAVRGRLDALHEITRTAGWARTDWKAVQERKSVRVAFRHVTGGRQALVLTGVTDRKCPAPSAAARFSTGH